MTASFAAVMCLCLALPALAQLGGSGTVQGTVKDPTGGVMVSVTVELANPVSGFRRTATTDSAGQFVQGQVGDDAVDPGAERAGRVEGGEGVVGAHEGVLGQVKRVLAVADEAIGDVVDGRLSVA